MQVSKQSSNLTFSSSITSRTAEAMAQLTGFPPKVLKYSIPVLKNESATAFVVITAAIGCPLPYRKILGYKMLKKCYQGRNISF